MKAAVSASGPHLQAEVDPRFGRCPYFLVVETEDLTFEAVENTSGGLGGGAGIQSAQFLAHKGVRTVLTGNCGPNAFRTLNAAGIQVVVGCTGTVLEAVARLKAGLSSPATGANVASHAGVGGGVAG